MMIKRIWRTADPASPRVYMQQPAADWIYSIYIICIIYIGIWPYRTYLILYCSCTHLLYLYILYYTTPSAPNRPVYYTGMTLKFNVIIIIVIVIIIFFRDKILENKIYEFCWQVISYCCHVVSIKIYIL